MINKTYGFKISKEARKEYLELEDDINNPKNRFIIVEDYNIDDGFYCRFYDNKIDLNGKPDFAWMIEAYFSDTEGTTGWEQIVLVDMKERK